MSNVDVSIKPQKRSGRTTTGRSRTLARLDRLAAGKKSQKALEATLEAMLYENPLRFFREIIRPLLRPEDLDFE